MRGLVLSGGGARGAYQVGVLKAIGEIADKHNIKNPFEIYTGVSAGAINATFLAAYAENFQNSSKKLCDLWSNIKSEQIFYNDAVSLGKVGFKWVTELSLRGNQTAGRALLDTTPLSEMLKNKIPFSKIMDNIDQGYIKNLAITAINYKNSEAVTFIEGKEDTQLWKRSRRHGEMAHLTAEHVMASSSIPLLFPPIQVGDRYFGDGCVRNVAPCSPALHLGAQKLIVIGVRRQSDLAASHMDENPMLLKSPSVARVINTVLNAVLLDGIELDIERLKRINDFVKKVPKDYQHTINFKSVDFAWISPSVDIGKLAREKANRLPRLLRYLLKGLGPLDDASELISYLLFDSEFCSELIECGYNDGLKNKEDIERIILP